MSEAKKYGWTGQGLRINLTTGEITKVPTQKDWIGGTALGYKIFWDEVPPKTQAFDEANKIVIAPGPLTGTGAVCSGRTSVTTMYPTTYPIHEIGSAHLGGDLGAKMKYAGYDFIVIEGKAKEPVYVYVNNDDVQIRKANHIWGEGTRRAAALINQETSPTASVTVIGPAGENLLPMSVIINAKSHTGGGIGGVWGSKNLKGLAIDGDQPIHIAADKEEWEKLVNRNKELLGALTQTVVSRYPHPLFEYHSLNSRWSGMPGKQWGAANPPINVPLDTRRLSKMAFRTNAGEFFLGDREWARHVRNNGCFACPIRCYPVIKDTATAAKYNVHPITEQTCGGLLFPIFFYPNLKNHPERNIEIAIVGSQLMDDLGLWCNYGQLQRDMIVMYQDGYWKKLLSKEEYDSLPWKKIDDVDASAMQDFLPRIAYRKGEFGKWLGETTPVMLDHFGIPVKTWSDDHRTLYWSNGHPKHHTNEDDGQLGCVLNCMWNRDPMAHAHVNFTRSGLPIKEMKHIAKVTWGDGSAVDQIGDYTPTNTYKMKRLQWVIARTELHNMLGLCSWMAPWEYCPDEKNQYVGDPNMEAKIFSAVTGVNKTGDDLDKDGIRAWMLQRVYTMRQLGSSNMRKDHDLVPGWIYTDPKDRKPFTKGTVRMDPDDINKSFDIFFEQVGCDKETGVPTTDTLKAYRLDFVIPVLQKEGLIK
ncbi:aldehyde ferredoxin oxidoreductase N-terminal domain-containing protein [Parasutterella excrementihominis]|uniref:aldehyde ferredoxin oxidoreductase N-terminal domain-containing protein n=1 Tax=Parasutterella excrementihominis TaxID=487175 RepID=UPI0026655006|nr:aldehyde ferredoxin oxidoreductase N-terminal domain-containing protein [Parasutterella excrementihominis]